ncbi:LysR family transcriptional regulator [Micromonosporaceae bacterium Da 78-11]
MPLDLNLLTALDALLEEGSVSGAADRLHLSAPAMSRTLGRLRRVTGDQVLVRTGRTMTPTPRAVAMRAQVHELLQQAEAVLSRERELDLGTLERTFTVRWHDALTTAVGPALLAVIRAEAPGVRLRLPAEPGGDSDDLRRGHVDVEAGATAPAWAELSSELLGHDDLVVVARAGHPLLRGGLSLQRYAVAEHVTVSRRGRLRDPVDEMVTRRVVAAAPTTIAALHLVSGSDLMSVVPRRATASLLAMLGLTTCPLPVPMAPIPLYLQWHQRNDGDRAHAWLRDRIRTVLRDAGLGNPAGSRPARPDQARPDQAASVA